MIFKIIPALALTTVNAIENLVFEDNFDKLDFKHWSHEIASGGYGNNEFEYYTNNRTNSFVKEGILYLQPTLTSDKFGEDFITNGVLDLTGASPADNCTGFYNGGCIRKADAEKDYIINPIQSARVRTV
jgi:beta-glucanase (GH16 family)